MSMLKTPSEEQVRTDFQAIKAELEKWGNAVDKILNDYLESAFTASEHVQKQAKHRVKDIDSYCEKVLLRKPTPNPLLETTDKVGTRVVLLTSNDVDNVSDFVQKCDQWEVAGWSRNYLDEIFSEPDVFGYQSNHFIVKPTDDYSSNIDRELLTCEIQIRTILQHAYAEISHDTVYKKSSVDNPKVRRMLASSMALLEATNDKFNQTYEELGKMDNFYYKLQVILTNIYKTIVSDFRADNYNTQLAMIVLNIYTPDEQRQISDEISDFIANNKETISEQINYFKDKSILFTQPIVLVALYGISELQTKTWANWPLSYGSIENVVEAMGYSIDSMK